MKVPRTDLSREIEIMGGDEKCYSLFPRVRQTFDKASAYFPVQSLFGFVQNQD